MINHRLALVGHVARQSVGGQKAWGGQKVFCPPTIADDVDPRGQNCIVVA